MKLQYITLIVLSTCLLGCDGNDNENQNEKNNQQPEKQESEKIKPSCLDAMGSSPEKMLTPKEVMNMFDVTQKELKQDTSPTSQKKYKNVLYYWVSDRKIEIEVQGRKMEVDAKNNIAVGYVSKLNNIKKKNESYVNYFDRAYGKKNKEEKEKIKKVIDEQNSGTNAKNNLKKMVDDQNIKMINDIGDRASREIITTNEMRTTLLNVLHQNIYFKIEVNVSENDQEDLKYAKKIAQKIIAKCQ